MTNHQQAQADYDRARHELALLYNEIQEQPQRFPAPYDAWVSGKLRLWIARERLREAEHNAAQDK